MGLTSMWTPLQKALIGAEAGWYAAATDLNKLVHPSPRSLAIASSLMETAIRDLDHGQGGRIFRGTSVEVDPALPHGAVEARGNGVTYRVVVSP